MPADLGSQKEQLVSLIRSAFDGHSAPAVDKIVDLPFPFDSEEAESYTDDEAERVRLFFAGREWKDLVCNLPNRAEVEYAFIFMLPEAAHYYTPAYLVTVLESWKQHTSATEALWSALLNPKSNPFMTQPTTGISAPPPEAAAKISRKWEAFQSRFSSQQNEAIGRFLDFMELSAPSFASDVENVRNGNPKWISHR